MRMRSIRLSKQIIPRTFFVYISHRKNGGKVNSNQTDAYSSLSDVQRFSHNAKHKIKDAHSWKDLTRVVLWCYSPTHKRKIFENKIRKLVEGISMLSV